MPDVTVFNGDVDLAVRVTGRGSRPVVLVHGHGTNLLTWSPLADLLEDTCRVVAYDRRGHGKSSSADSYTIDELADDLRTVVTDLALTAPVLVGHSVGAWDALAAAAGEPSVAGVICLDHAIATSDPVWHTTYRPIPRNARIAQHSDDRLLTDGLRPTELERMTNEASSAPELQPWHVYGPMVQRNLARRSEGRYWVRPSLTDHALIQEGWTSVGAEPYDAIRCEVTLLLAEPSPGPIHDMLHRLARRHGLRTIAVDTGHDIHIERPDLVAELVRGFL